MVDWIELGERQGPRFHASEECKTRLETVIGESSFLGGRFVSQTVYPMIAIAIVTLLGCSEDTRSAQQNAVVENDIRELPPPAEQRAALEDDIREVVFKHLLSRYCSRKDAGNRKLRCPCCLSVSEDTLPTAALMKRFQGYTPPIIGIAGIRPVQGFRPTIDSGSDEPASSAQDTLPVVIEDEFWRHSHRNAINELGQPGLAYDAKTGEAVTLLVDRIEWLNRSEVVVKGRWYLAPVVAEFWRFRVTLRNGMWHVERAKIECVS